MQKYKLEMEIQILVLIKDLILFLIKLMVKMELLIIEKKAIILKLKIMLTIIVLHIFIILLFLKMKRFLIFASLLWIKVFSYFYSLKSSVSFSECRAFSLAKINFISLLDKLPSMIRKIA
jgi:hypothetical protein